MLIFESDCFTCPSEFNRLYLPTDFGVAGFPKMFLRLCKRILRCPKIILTMSDITAEDVRSFPEIAL